MGKRRRRSEKTLYSRGILMEDDFVAAKSLQFQQCSTSFNRESGTA
jgi:hypothetical protein